MLDTEAFKEFVALTNKKKELKEKLDVVTNEIISKEKFLIDNLMSNDMTKISISGKTCYTKINTFAVIKDRDKAIKLLKESGYEDFIAEKYNINSISKLVRDLLEKDGELPENFGDTITAGQTIKMGVTKS